MIVAAVNVILVALANLVAVTFADAAAAAEDTVDTVVDLEATAAALAAAWVAEAALVDAEAGFGFY